MGNQSVSISQYNPPWEWIDAGIVFAGILASTVWARVKLVAVWNDTILIEFELRLRLPNQHLYADYVRSDDNSMEQQPQAYLWIQSGVR